VASQHVEVVRRQVVHHRLVHAPPPHAPAASITHTPWTPSTPLSWSSISSISKMLELSSSRMWNAHSRRRPPADPREAGIATRAPWSPPPRAGGGPPSRGLLSLAQPVEARGDADSRGGDAEDVCRVPPSHWGRQGLHAQATATSADEEHHGDSVKETRPVARRGRSGGPRTPCPASVGWVRMGARASSWRAGEHRDGDGRPADDG
jgi:hypothetical protein